MSLYGRPDDDLVPKGQSARETRKTAQKQPLPPEAPPPPWQPLYVDNEPRGKPHLPPYVNNTSPIEIFKLFWDDDTLNHIVAYTNENARLHPSQSHGARAWKPVTLDEIHGYFAVVIHMGIHHEAQITDYWREDQWFGVYHLVGEIMSRNRFEQIDRYIYCCPPRHDDDLCFTSTFERVINLSDHIRRISQTYWLPGLNLAVDESMVRFFGRARETTTIDCKAAGTGFKSWFLNDSGYCLNWRFHCKGQKPGDGPYKIRPTWQKAGFSATHSVVLDLVLDHHTNDVNRRLLQPTRHVIWLDNLFTTIPLLERLRTDGIGAAGTVRTSKTPREIHEDSTYNTASQASSQPSGLLLTPPSSQQALQPSQKSTEGFSDKLINCKPWRDALPWGTIRYDVSQTGLVGMFAWKDSNVVLFATTVGNLAETVTRNRRRPAPTRTGARQTRKLFGSKVRMELEIPKLIDDYNHFMGGVDQFDQLRSYYSILRTHYKTWRPLFTLLIEISLVNSFKLCTANRKTTHDAHRNWLLTLVEQLRALASRQIRRKALPSPLQLSNQSIHELRKLFEYPKLRTCEPCAERGRRSKAKPILRNPLSEIINTNYARPQRPIRTSFGCFQCKIPICSSKERPCWSEHLKKAQSLYLHRQELN